MHSSHINFVDQLAAGASLKAIMFGTSITFGSQVDPNFDPDVTFHSQWGATLRTKFPQSNLTIVNKGLPGNKIADALARADRDVIKERPDLTVVEFGINDCWDGPDRLDEFESGLCNLIDQIRASLETPIIMLTANMLNHSAPPFAVELAWFAEKTAHAQNSGWTLDYMNAVRRVARDNNLPLADGYAKWERERAKGIDTDALLVNRANHPTFAGHSLLAEALIELFE